MKTHNILILLIVLLASCNNSIDNTEKQADTTATVEVKTPTEQPIIDSLDKATNSNTYASDTLKTLSDSVAASNSIIREGEHYITLQWISWDYPGIVTITKTGENKYKIKGGQESRDDRIDYLKIDGTLTAKNERELIFNGTLIYQLELINDGQPCDKSGELIFKASGDRKYWRMQDMINCEGGRTTDYVDIHF